MDDDVGAEGQRLLHQGSGEGVVDDDDDPARSGFGDDDRQVGYLHEGVGRRLQPDRAGTVQRRDDRYGVLDVDPADLAARGLHLPDERTGGVVGRQGSNQRAVRREDGEGGRDRRHAGGETQRVATFEGPDGRFESRPGGVRCPAVAEVQGHPVGAGGGVGGIRAGQLDRRIDRCTGAAWGAPRGDDDGGGGQVRGQVGHPASLGGHGIPGQ